MTNKLMISFEGRNTTNETKKYIASTRESDKNYIIFFTPRSGSSWLTEALTKTGCLGRPEEWFNPEFVPHIIDKIQVGTIEDYIAVLKRRHKSQNSGIFGVEMSFFHLKLAMECCDFDRAFDPFIPIYLKRDDFVLQGISLYRAVESGVFHSVSIPKHARTVEYSANGIEKWVLHIMQQEWGFERYFSRKGLNPLRLTYEELFSNRDECLSKIFSAIGVTVDDWSFLSTVRHQKLGNQQNQEWAKQFRQERKEFVSYWSQHRGQERAWSIALGRCNRAKYDTSG